MNVFCPAFHGCLEHGGLRRSLQIADLAREVSGSESLRLAPPPGPFGRALRGRLAQPLRLLRALRDSVRRESGVKARVQYALTVLHYEDRLREAVDGVAWIEYSSAYSRYAPEVARRLGVPYVLFPQNIEFLVRGAVVPDPGLEFVRESEAIRGAAQVACISDQDAAVCETFNEKVVLVPYRPSEVELQRLDRVGVRREVTPRAGYLALGSASNPSTHPGFLDVVRLLRGRGVPPDEILVAGYGTERLRGALESDCVVMGGVEPAVLEDLLAKCHGVVVHQRQTSGFLTRLVELNRCGVPVLVAGGYRQAQGLESFGIFTDPDQFLPQVPAGPHRRFDADGVRLGDGLLSGSDRVRG